MSRIRAGLKWETPVEIKFGEIALLGDREDYNKHFC